ncbi:MAG: hypothetical protein JW739_09270 [Opitutales bacterium]|nr:hypothetical protein [Opitutales bacterium]
MKDKLHQINEDLSHAQGLERLRLLLQKMQWSYDMRPALLRELVEQAERLFSELDLAALPVTERDCLEIGLAYGKAFVAFRDGALDKALTLLDRVRVNLPRCENQALAGSIINLHTAISSQMGDFLSAVDDYLKVLDYNGISEQGHLSGTACISLAMIYLEMEQFEKAAHLLEEALQQSDLEPKSLKIYFLIALGKAHREMDHVETSKAYLLEAQKVVEKSQSGIPLCHVRLELAETYRVDGMFLDALKLAQDALASARDLDECFLMGLGCFYLGMIWGDERYSQHRLDAALPLLSEALTLFEQSHRKPWVRRVHLQLSRTYALFGKYKAALEHHRIAFEQMSSYAFPVESLRALGKLEANVEHYKERKKHELLLSEVEQLRAENEHFNKLVENKNEYIAIAAHDLKNPIAAIRGVADLLSRDESIRGNSVQFRMLQNIRNCAADTFEIITNLLDLNRMDVQGVSSYIIPCVLGEIASDVVGLFEERSLAKDIHIYLENSATDLLALVDPLMYKQMLGNLISNALKFSEKGTKVLVSIHISGGGEHIETDVTDQGPGISLEDQKRLFRRFEKLSNKPTAGEHSTGLGLAITKQFAKANHGDILCLSKVGKGTTFTIRLPLA